jgi:L-amino acid N-acyltransferase YncA
VTLAPSVSIWPKTELQEANQQSDQVGDRPNKADSNGSDEVVMNRGANFKSRNQRQLRGGSARPNSDSRYRARPRTTQQIPRQNADGTPNRPAAVENHAPQDDVGCQIKVPSGVQKTANKAPSQEALDELKRLQEEIVLQAHLNRYKDHEDYTANPESLAKCRDGPGTDPKSDVYKSIARCRLAANPNATSSNPTSIPEDKFEGDVDDRYFVDEIRSRVQKFHAAKLDAQRESYHNSVSVYPAIVDGQIFLSRYPSAEHERLQKTPSNAERQTGNQDDSHKPEHCSKVKWEDRWEMRPRACSTYEGFRDWFRHWLEMQTGDSSNIDIHHQAFFDGTAHMDGIKSLYILDLGDVLTRLDMTSEATRLHYHETAEGYCHNLALHMKAAEEEARTRRKQARDAFIEGLKVCSPKDPNSPRANVYLRGVEDRDIPGLLMILNWYGQKSNLSSSLGTLDEQDVRQRIEDSRRAKLPFIVAAERRRGPSADDTPEKILGYALARDSLGLQTTGRYTAELEIYIKPDHKRRGIGKCLLDKLIEVCDATYVPKRGFFYDAGCDDKTGIYPGGSRTLKRLVFTISYSVPERSQIKWLIDWLERDYHFEQQGVLKGARVKFERL